MGRDYSIYGLRPGDVVAILLTSFGSSMTALVRGYGRAHELTTCRGCGLRHRSRVTWGDRSPFANPSRHMIQGRSCRCASPIGRPRDPDRNVPPDSHGSPAPDRRMSRHRILDPSLVWHVGIAFANGKVTSVANHSRESSQMGCSVQLTQMQCSLTRPVQTPFRRNIHLALLMAVLRVGSTLKRVSE